MMKYSYSTINLLTRFAQTDTNLKVRATQYSIGPRRFFSDNVESASEASKKISKEPPLFDLHGRRHDYLRISLTERCNLRCQYCMPAEGVPLCPKSELMTREEMFRAVRVMADAGVTKLRLTGGEPTLRSDLAEIIQELNSIPGIQSVSMTTNGLVLTRRLPALQRAGLVGLNISLDTLRPDRYEHMARRPGLPRVLAAIDLALQLGFRPLKVNTVLMRGFNDDEILDFVEFTRDKEVEVRFIEFMPFSGNRWDDSRLVPYREALGVVRAARPGLAPLAPRPHHTARVWAAPGHTGTVGFISSMTDHFCATCNRLRLTADGGLKVCLFGRDEVSLRDAIRAGLDDDELLALVRAALDKKRPKHAARVGARAPPARRLLSPAPARRLAARAYGTGRRADGGAEGAECAPEEYGQQLTHLDGAGRARMLDVGDKPVTRRVARAECLVHVSARLVRLLRDARVPKGDALCVARVAGAMGAKRAADLLPLCHPLPLSSARVELRLPRGAEAEAAGGAVRVECEVRVEARTGAEMEALTGCAVAALALYDMCKAVDRGMRVTDLRVVHKAGGRSDAGRPRALPDPALPAAAPAPPARDADDRETYAPTNFMYF